MAHSTEEFVNPKSMVTPGFAAAAVASVAGALFSMFAIALPAALIVLSFFVGAVVFHSKEFADPQTKRWAKGFYYILNSLIIFAMATGTHSVLDKRDRTLPPRVGISFFDAAYAQDPPHAQPLLKQERPIFYDWTRVTAPPSASLDAKGIVKFRTEKDFGTFKGVLIAAGLATPEYKVQMEIDKSKFPDEIKSVKWVVPAAYFPKDQVTVTDATKNFAVDVEAWKAFPVRAEIELKSGEKIQVRNFVSFDAKKN